MPKIMKAGKVLTSNSLNGEIILSENIRKQNELDRIANEATRANVVEAIEVEYAPRLTGVESQLAETVTKSDIATAKADAMASGSPKGVYATLVALQTAYPTGMTGAYLVTADGKWYYWSGTAWTAGGTYQATGIADSSVTTKKTTFIGLDTTLNLFDGEYSNKRVLGASPSYSLATGTTSVNKTAIIPIKPNTVYSIIKDASDVFKAGTDTILNRADGQTLLGAIAYVNNTPLVGKNYTFTSGPNDVVLYVYVTATSQNTFLQVVEGTQADFSISEYPIVPKGVEIYNKREVNNLIATGNANRPMIVKKVGEVLSIYIPTKDGKYVLWVYQHFINTIKKYDSWKIHYLKVVDTSLNTLWNPQDELECEGAILENGATDFIGGFHGDEYNISLSIMIDGNEIPIDAANFSINANEVKIFNKSYLNRCDTTSRIFTRYRINTFNKDGCTVENKYIAEGVISIESSKIAMIGCYKMYNGQQQIKYGRADDDFTKIDVSTGFTSTSLAVARRGVKTQELWGNTSGLYIRVEAIFDRTKFPDNKQYIEDFGDRAKIYFDVTGVKTLQIGDTIECKSIYTVY